MTPRFTWPHPRVDAVRGCVAIERGPEVMCVESVDVPEVDHVDALRVDTSIPPSEADGHVSVRGAALRLPDGDWPYAGTAQTPAASGELDIRLTAYHDWANRGPSTMRVWIPVV